MAHLLVTFGVRWWEHNHVCWEAVEEGGDAFPSPLAEGCTDREIELIDAQLRRLFAVWAKRAGVALPQLPSEVGSEEGDGAQLGLFIGDES